MLQSCGSESEHGGLCCEAAGTTACFRSICQMDPSDGVVVGQVFPVYVQWLLCCLCYSLSGYKRKLAGLVYILEAFINTHECVRKNDTLW